MEDIEVLISSHSTLIAVETVEEERLEQLIKQIAWRLNLPCYTWDVNTGLIVMGGNSPIYKTQDALVALGNVATIKSGLFLFKDLQHCLEDPKIIRKLKEIAKPLISEKTIIFVSNTEDYPEELQDTLVTYKMPLPTEEQLREILNRFLKTMPQVRISLSDTEMNSLINNLKGLTAIEAKRAINEAVILDKSLDKEDLKTVADLKKKFIEKEQLVEYTSPEENFNIVGGLPNLKKWMAQRKVAFGKNQYNLPAPKGILLIGIPGCGKTLCARAIANELNLGLIKFNPANLYSKFIGESEENFQKVIKLTESLAPIVMLIDEVEKVMPNSSSSDSDGGLSKRLFGTFLGWMQDKKESVFVVATSNDIQSLPPEFSRQGRFDEVFFVDLPTREERRDILNIHLKRRNINIEVIDTNEIADLTEGFSGSELEQLILSSMYSVASTSGNISNEIIKEEIKKTMPLSKRSPEEIESLRLWAKTHCIEA
ncbi:MAG: AAA family ATPase [Actinobacteria bacterium]|nr:MAG: AAA family ATPase [Actinomycetota bacterium]